MRYTILCILLVFTSCVKEFTVRPKVEGSVFNSSTGRPIPNAKVLFIDCLNSDCTGEITYFSDKKGNFSIKKEIKKYVFIKPDKYSRPYYSYSLVISKKGYIPDTLDIRRYDKNSVITVLDTVKLNTIY